MRELPIRVYLAGRYSDREKLRAASIELLERSIVPTSSWVYGCHDSEMISSAVTAKHDLLDIRNCDLLLLFGGGSTAGGKFWEAGYAMALGRPVWLVDWGEEDKRTVFCDLCFDLGPWDPDAVELRIAEWSESGEFDLLERVG